MKVRNRRPWAVQIARLDFEATVDADGIIEVPDTVGMSLIEQHDAWEKVSTKAKTAADKEQS